MNGLLFSFAREIPLERFDGTKVILGIKGVNEIVVGEAKVDFDNETISVYKEDASWHVGFEEVALIRWPYSGIVHDYWNENRGDMIHVPGLKEGVR